MTKPNMCEHVCIAGVCDMVCASRDSVGYSTDPATHGGMFDWQTIFDNGQSGSTYGSFGMRLLSGK